MVAVLNFLFNLPAFQLPKIRIPNRSFSHFKEVKGEDIPSLSSWDMGPRCCHLKGTPSITIGGGSWKMSKAVGLMGQGSIAQWPMAVVPMLAFYQFPPLAQSGCVPSFWGFLPIS